MKLHDIKHVALNEADWNEDQIIKWLKQVKISNYSINADKTIDIDGDLNLFDRRLNNLPVQFGKVTGNFYARHNLFSSLRGFPTDVAGDFSFSHNPNIKNLMGGNGIKIGGRLLLENTLLDSLEGIGHSFSTFIPSPDRCNISLALIARDIKKGGIGLMLLEGAQTDMRDESSDYTRARFAKAWSIIKHYMGKPDDLFECQAELIDADLEQFAHP